MHLAMQCVEVLTRDGMAEITLNRPKVNAMNQALLREMTDVFGRLAQDDAVSGVLVRGTGQCLSAGLDLHELASLDRERLSSFLDDFDSAFGAAFRLPNPFAAAVRGHAIAGGMILAMCADFIALGTQPPRPGDPSRACGHWRAARLRQRVDASGELDVRSKLTHPSGATGSPSSRPIAS
ncbi:enoyl-CoA hydratase/isomerase family protein [Sorangium sp. So ce426]|uniref:enoyl-CoA hydratase/isomerase family protein n=1 Tax=Sorangium sp. So ce426 TaxID=3133312 RepID=UPI003F5B7C14